MTCGKSGVRRAGTGSEREATRMKPITFSLTHTLPLAPEEIAGQILDLANWTDFTGFRAKRAALGPGAWGQLLADRKGRDR